jgi:hypothetical protein
MRRFDMRFLNLCFVMRGPMSVGCVAIFVMFLGDTGSSLLPDSDGR